MRPSDLSPPLVTIFLTQLIVSSCDFCLFPSSVFPHTEQLSTQAGAVFEDVVEEFWKLSLIKQRFEEWKFGVPASYEQVYVPLFLPKLFAPFVRLQLLQWNPLEVSSMPDMLSVPLSQL